MTVILADGKTTPLVNTQRMRTEEALSHVEATLRSLGKVLAEYHDRVKIHTQEFYAAGVHVDAAWRCIEHARQAIN